MQSVPCKVKKKTKCGTVRRDMELVFRWTRQLKESHFSACVPRSIELHENMRMIFKLLFFQLYPCQKETSFSSYYQTRDETTNFVCLHFSLRCCRRSIEPISLDVLLRRLGNLSATFHQSYSRRQSRPFTAAVFSHRRTSFGSETHFAFTPTIQPSALTIIIKLYDAFQFPSSVLLNCLTKREPPPRVSCPSPPVYLFLVPSNLGRRILGAIRANESSGVLVFIKGKCEEKIMCTMSFVPPRCRGKKHKANIN